MTFFVFALYYERNGSVVCGMALQKIHFLFWPFVCSGLWIIPLRGKGAAAEMESCFSFLYLGIGIKETFPNFLTVYCLCGFKEEASNSQEEKGNIKGLKKKVRTWHNFCSMPNWNVRCEKNPFKFKLEKLHLVIEFCRRRSERESS